MSPEILSIVIESVLILVIPVLAILVNKKLYQARLKILAGVFLITLVLAVWHGVPQDVLGFANITSGQLLWYLSAAIVFSILLYFTNKVFVSKNQKIPSEIYASSLLLSFSQEFIFNAYFFSKFNSVFGVVVSLIIIGILFGFMHQTLEHGWTSFFVSFGSGVLLAGMFAVFPNLWLATLVHSLANIQALHYRLPGIGPSLDKLM